MLNNLINVMETWAELGFGLRSSNLSPKFFPWHLTISTVEVTGKIDLINPLGWPWCPSL